jgi:diguanylate cyclase (GGDEF)-like protein/PAS domain S-box-containing protein
MQTNIVIKNNENRYRSLIDSTDTSIYLVDRNYNYLYINEKHRERIKVNENQYIGQPFSALHSQKETELFIKKAEKVFKTGKSMQFTYKSFRENRYYLQTFSPVMGNDNEPIAITVLNKDITELKHMEEELRALSLKDDLTVLYNRRGFTTLAEQYLKLAKREKRGFFVLYADLDNLKGINDKYGHHEGGYALIQIANILTDSLRESDIIARLGGDEFAVIHVAFDEGNIDIIISRLQEKIESYNALSDRGYKLSLSVGTSYFDPENPYSLEQLLIKADEAMYEQKKNKRTSPKTPLPSYSKK